MNFILTNDQRHIADQIADMLNKHNKLYKVHTWSSIIGSTADYFIEVASSATTSLKVVGCVALEPEFKTLSKIKHLCVLPECRRMGLAKKLVGTAIANCRTDNVYMTVREDNLASLGLAASMGFVFVNKIWSRDHNIIALGRSTKCQHRSLNKSSMS